MKHTPGPYHIELADDEYASNFYIKTGDGQIIAGVWPVDPPIYNMPGEVTMANARLFRGSAEMYAVLAEIEESCQPRGKIFDADNWLARVKALLTRIREGQG